MEIKYRKRENGKLKKKEGGKGKIEEKKIRFEKCRGGRGAEYSKEGGEKYSKG